jgi:hypothetical protein
MTTRKSPVLQRRRQRLWRPKWQSDLTARKETSAERRDLTRALPLRFHKTLSGADNCQSKCPTRPAHSDENYSSTSCHKANTAQMLYRSRRVSNVKFCSRWRPERPSTEDQNNGVSVDCAKLKVVENADFNIAGTFGLHFAGRWRTASRRLPLQLVPISSISCREVACDSDT